MRFLLLLCLVLPLAGCPTGPTPEKVAELNEVVLANEGITALKEGDPAPAFTASTAQGERVAIGVKDDGEEAPDPESAVGEARTYTVLYFFPADFTPNSTKHLVDLSKGLEQLTAQDIKVYGISTASDDMHAEFARKQGVKVPLLADTGAISRTYGALIEGGKYPQRTLVGIAPDGTIGFYLRGFGHQPLVKFILEKTGRTPAKE